MIEHGRGDAELPVHQGPNSQEVRHHCVDGGGFTEGPGNGRSVVASSGRGAPSLTGAYKGEGGLLQDKGCQFKVGIRDAPLRIVKTDEVRSDVFWPGQAPHVVEVIFVGFYPYPPYPHDRSASKADVCGEPLHNFRKVGGACGHVCAEPAPKTEVRVKACGDIGCGLVRVVGCGEGLL